VSGIDQNTLNTVAAQLGVSGDQLNKLKNQAANGSISSDQIQQLSARFGALNLSDSQVSAIAHTLGLNDSELTQIQQTIAASRGGQGGGPGAPLGPGEPPPSAGAPGPAMPQYAMTQQTATAILPPSPIETRVQQLDNPYQVPQTPTTDNLAQFGYNFFSTQVSTFAPVGNVPVGDNYVIGPGDEIDILLWGRVNTVLNPTVDREGMIQVSELGPIQVAGLTFAQAKKLIESRAGQITGVQVDVTMGQLRTINVTVAGDVTQPGSYTISALSRVSNALVAAGGVSKVGSLRHIEVRHGNQLVDVVDLYDILLHGNNSADRRLEEGDVIFVPVIGSVVGIAGDVNRPAIYELKRDQTETLDGALKLAGGITGFGFGDRVQVERIQDHRRMVALDVSLRRLSNQNFAIRDGDVIKINPVLPGRANTVVLSGNVRRSGEFQWYKGMRVSDLVRKGEGVLPNTYFKYALIRRLSGPQKTIHFHQVDLGEALANPRMGQGDVALQPKDELDIYNLDDIRDLPSVAVNGEVRMPGRFVLSQDMKVSDLVYMAGGLKDDAYQDRAVLVRANVTPGGKAVRSHIDVNLRAIINENLLDIPLKANDELFVRTILDWQRPPQFVEVTGEVRQPGIYDYYTGMRVSDLVAIAGGTNDDAYLKMAELARTEVINGTHTRHTYVDIDLRSKATGANDRNLLLMANDELLIKAASNYHLPFTVLVSGKVMRPGTYTITEGERLDSLLTRCGGFVPNAFPQGIVFTRVSVRTIEQQNLEEARRRLSEQVANAALLQTQLGSVSTTSSSGGGNVAATLMMVQNVLAASQNQQAEGRVVIHVNPKWDGKQGLDNVVLEDGDQIAVPVMPSSVNVLGEVNHPASFVVRSDTVRDYINQAGGFTQYADQDQVMVIKADGSVLTVDGFSQSRRTRLFPALPLISDGLMGAKLDVGDTVYVPVDLKGLQNLQETKDITTIIANSATALGVLGLLATNL
jgi:polysaccharide export outer membrane protein